MARISKAQELADIHAEALQEFDTIQSALRDERMQCLQDRRFYSIAGAQWEGALSQQFENKPKFEVNKIHLAVIRIISEYRNNRITVDFVSKDGEENDTLSDTCDGLYRADEKDSGAEEAYDNAFEEAIGGGFGAWRLRTKYEDEYDEDDERQRICIEPIFDADSSVFFDLGAKRQDKADAKRCFVITAKPHADYKEEYGDDPASWPKDIHQHEFDWLTPEFVYVAEYYRVEEVSETVYFWRNAITDEEAKYRDEDFEDDEALRDTLTATGWKEDRKKRVKTRKVRKLILSGSKILEDCGHIAGKCIPIVPMYGKRWFIDGVERCMGHVRLAKDAQRIANMQRSKLGELSAYSSIEKPIFTPEQVAGHQVMWSEDNIKNYPFMLVNSITDANGQLMPAGPIGYTKPPQIPPAMAALLQITEQDMMDLLGNQQAGEQLQANVSSKAVELVQNKLDMQVFIYMSNMRKAVKRSGEIWLSIARDILVEPGRKMKSIGSQGEVGSVILKRPVMKDGAVEYENDLSNAKFDVDSDVGPSSSSKRASTVRALTGMTTITDDPETRQVLGAMTMLNMEGEGISEVRDYFRKKLLKMGVVKPTDAEAKAMEEAKANEKEDPNAIFLQAAGEEAVAKAALARANTVLTIAKAEEINASIENDKAGVEIDAFNAETDRLKAGQSAATDISAAGAKPAAEPAKAEHSPEMIAILNQMVALGEHLQAMSDEREAPEKEGGIKEQIAQVMAKLDQIERQPQPQQAPPVINVTIEKGGTVKREMKMTAPSGQVYTGTVEEVEDGMAC